MPLHLETLEYQTRAVNAVADVFAGCRAAPRGAYALHPEFNVIGNALDITDEELLANIAQVQAREFANAAQPPRLDAANPRDISVEMETGTGKTLTYLQTALELHTRHGACKFIVVAPSVAIREGVLKTLESAKPYLRGLYKNAGYDFCAYDGDSKQKITVLKDFAENHNPAFLVMNIQSFQLELNIINRERDDSPNGRSLMDVIASARPIVILDEPQNMDSKLRRDALQLLNPLIKLRYSATHLDPYNSVFCLSPTEAYNKGMVKKIEIASVVQEDAAAFVFAPLQIMARRGANPLVRARVEARNAAGEYAPKIVNLAVGADIGDRTNNKKYQDVRIARISARERQVTLSNGMIFAVGEDVTQDKEKIFRAQLEKTVKTHFEKQARLGDNIKVLSLVFIDRVANYVEQDGLIRRLFEEAFDAHKSNHARFSDVAAREAHSGYFSKSGGAYKDTKGGGKTDESAYKLIMRDKERLLSFDERVCFVFSHSALKEGWDNPNVFNICTLHETESALKKRQVIGRGMRLCVNRSGQRVHDDDANLLTVIANESYQQYIAELYNEFAEARQTGFAPPEQRKRRRVRFKKEFAVNNAAFMELWRRIRGRTRFRIRIHTPSVIEDCAALLQERLQVAPPAVRVDTVQLLMRDSGRLEYMFEDAYSAEPDLAPPRAVNICGQIADETGLTKKTVFRIIDQSDGWAAVDRNPVEYVRQASRLICEALNAVITDGIQYMPVQEQWDMAQLFADMDAYEDKTVASPKSVYDYTVCDGAGERVFAENLQNSRNVKVFAKMPRQFVVHTPVGNYNPDWAIVWHQDGQDALYLVRETKFVEDLEMGLRGAERQKIECARAHFSALSVDYKVVQKTDFSDLLRQKRDG